MSVSTLSPRTDHQLASEAKAHKDKWKYMAPIGLIGVGFGACAVGRATVKWAGGRPYFWHGTFALFCLNTSLSVFGDAVKNRALYDMKTGQ